MSATSYLSPSIIIALATIILAATHATAATYNVTLTLNITLANQPAQAEATQIQQNIKTTSQQDKAKNTITTIKTNININNKKTATRTIKAPTNYQTTGEDQQGNTLWNQTGTAGNYWQTPAQTIYITITKTQTITKTITNPEKQTIPEAPQQIGTNHKNTIAIAIALLIPLTLLALASLAKNN